MPTGLAQEVLHPAPAFPRFIFYLPRACFHSWTTAPHPSPASSRAGHDGKMQEILGLSFPRTPGILQSVQAGLSLPFWLTELQGLGTSI